MSIFSRRHLDSVHLRRNNFCATVCKIHLKPLKLTLIASQWLEVLHLICRPNWYYSFIYFKRCSYFHITYLLQQQQTFTSLKNTRGKAKRPQNIIMINPLSTVIYMKLFTNMFSGSQKIIWKNGPIQWCNQAGFSLGGGGLFDVSNHSCLHFKDLVWGSLPTPTQLRLRHSNRGA